MRGSIKFLLLTMSGLLLFFMLPLHAHRAQKRADTELKTRMAALARLQLTDLCLTSEARYTRHPAMADHHAPFQEHPMALEHFPSGSLILPPPPFREKP